MIYSPNVNYTGDMISFDNIDYSVKSKLDVLNVEEYFSIQDTDTYYFIVPDEESIENIYNCVTEGDGDWNGLYYYYGLDVSGERENQTILYEKISSRISGMTPGEGSLMSVNTQCAEYYRTEFLSVYGGFFFLGLFLSIIFIMATVLIMYYKQISEGYDDKTRFEIMQKVGMSRAEVKSTVGSQVLTVFFLPLAAACIHIAAAFMMITRLLEIFNLTNVALFAVCTAVTIIVFALIYSVVYVLTARAYYKIVE
jgi:putative ABC transport system permease protein